MDVFRNKRKALRRETEKMIALDSKSETKADQTNDKTVETGHRDIGKDIRPRDWHFGIWDLSNDTATILALKFFSQSATSKLLENMIKIRYSNVTSIILSQCSNTDTRLIQGYL